jgi:hypothetical protein
MGIANLPIGTPLNVKTSLVKLEEEEEHEEYLHKMKTMPYKKKRLGRWCTRWWPQNRTSHLW